MKPILKLVDVWKIFKLGKVEVPAVRGMNLEVREGEFLSIMGPSGSGKSTVMNMVGCLDVPTRGKIYLEGDDISEMPESDLAQIRGKIIGFVFQQFNLIPTMTALENVMLPTVFQGLDEDARTRRAEKLLTKVGLGSRMHHKPNELSGGEQQRVAIARALTNNPDILLADEPTGNLDSKTGEEIMRFISKLHKEEHKTIVIITHDLHVAKHAKRIAYLRDGKIIKDKKIG